MRVERGKTHRTTANEQERGACSGVEPSSNRFGLERTEVRGVAAPDISMFGCGGLKLNTGDMNSSPREVAAGGGGNMLYGIHAALNQRFFSNDSVIADYSSSFSVQLHAPAPDRPLSTR